MLKIVKIRNCYQDYDGKWIPVQSNFIQYAMMYNELIIIICNSELELITEMDKLQKALEKTKRENNSNRPS
jgi:hypothetical protein